MEPIVTGIVMALAAGATAGLKKVATKAVTDAYGALRRLVCGADSGAAPLVEEIELDPTSQPMKQALARRLERTPKNPEIEAAVKRLLDALVELRKNPAAAPLFDFEELEAGRNFKMTDIDADGPVLRAKKAKFGDDAEFSRIRVKRNDEKHS
jgi:hypothetical protein